MFGLIILENIAFFGYNLIVLVVGSILGFAVGSYEARTVTSSIEKHGKFRRAWKPLLLVIGLAILVFPLSAYGLTLGIVSFGTMYSAVAFVPMMSLGDLAVSWRWEKRNHKEIQTLGSWRATLYAIPKGLNAAERYKYRWDMEQRLRQRSG